MVPDYCARSLCVIPLRYETDCERRVFWNFQTTSAILEDWEEEKVEMRAAAVDQNLLWDIQLAKGLETLALEQTLS